MEVAVVSDTHVPTRVARLPPSTADRLRAADHVLHAGDFDTPEALATIRDLAGGPDALTGVRGNTDHPGVDLPRVATATLGGVTFVLTHGHDGPGGYRQRVARTVREHGGPDAVGVCGHTHDYMDETADGVRLLNPGSATGANAVDERSLLVARVADGDLAVTRHRG